MVPQGCFLIAKSPGDSFLLTKKSYQESKEELTELIKDKKYKKYIDAILQKKIFDKEV